MDTTGFVETVMAECDRTEIPEIAFGIVPCCCGGGTLIVENIVVEISLRFERITVHESGSGTIIHDYVVDKVGRSCISSKEILDDKVATVVADVVADYIIGIAPHAHTGNQIMAINTLFQLLALQEQEPELLQKAEQVLFMPDLFAALLGAEPVCERSIASTSQMLDPRTGQWSREVLAAYGLPENRFAPLVASGTVTGTLANGAKIIAVAGHDTQCASAAMPCAEEDAEHTAFLSCGTWSLLGTELDAPILAADSCQSGLSNELGANGKINYLKNIIGLWLIQESRREYKRRGQAYSFAELEQQALAAEPLRSFIDPDAPEFVAPGDLPGRIQEFCRKTGQPVPETVGAVMRCIYESLALKYRYAIEQLSAVTGRAFTTLHVLGGGTKDRLLCQMTADCCGLTVKAGPVEATALGNIMIQLKALGLLDSITQGRRLIAETEVIKTHTPSTQNYAEWNAAYDRFKTLL